MVEEQIGGVEFIGVNTDKQALKLCKAPTAIQIGEKLTGGKGAGSNPDVGRKAAEKLGKKYEDVNLIVCHLGGGVSVGAHQHGRVVDVCNVKVEGAMGMEPAGGLPVNQLINYCFSGKTKDEVKRTFGRRAGMFSYLGTTDFRVVCAKVVEGDPKAVEAYQALVYQLAKDIGVMDVFFNF